MHDDLNTRVILSTAHLHGGNTFLTGSNVKEYGEVEKDSQANWDAKGNADDKQVVQVVSCTVNAAS